MRTFAAVPNHTAIRGVSKYPPPNPVAPQLRLRDARMWQSQPDDWRASEAVDRTATDAIRPRIAFDFTRIPISPGPAQANREKLATNQPGDQYEQEADRMSEHVNRVPAFAPALSVTHAVVPDVQRKCACGGTCSKCRSQQPDRDHQQLQRKAAAADLAPAAPALVHLILRSPGQPLDDSTRAFMEARFGRDFSRVRVHADGIADASAKMLGAQAYTIGNHVAFAAGRYLPSTSNGRELLAHELTHVVQQSDGRPARGTIQREPAKKTQDTGSGIPPDELLWSTAVWPKLDAEGEVLMLAANPDHAHDKWKSLSLQARIGVAIYMEKYYGSDFAHKFVAIHDAAKVPDAVFRQMGPETTAAQLTARGFHLAGRQMQMGVEIWFDPSGDRLHRVIPRQKSEEKKPEDKPEAKTPARQETKPPTQVDPQTPPEKQPPPTHEVCKESRKLSDSICDNSGLICRIAGELGPGDTAAQASCEKAKKSCTDSKKKAAECEPLPTS
jgi:hypothetical protein